MMPEVVTQKLTDYLKLLEDAGKTGADFLSAEVPQFVRELLNWIVIDNAITAICSFVAFIATVTVMYLIHRAAIKRINDWDTTPWPLVYLIVFILGVPAIQFMSETFVHGKQAAKAYYAPRVVLVEEIQKMVK